MGLTQAQISTAANLERSRYAHYEKDTTPSTEILRKLAAILNVSMDQLLYEEKDINVQEKDKDIDNRFIETFLFNELKSDEKLIIMRYRLLSKEGKLNIQKSIDDKVDKQEI